MNVSGLGSPSYQPQTATSESCRSIKQAERILQQPRIPSQGLSSRQVKRLLLGTLLAAQVGRVAGQDEAFGIVVITIFFTVIGTALVGLCTGLIYLCVTGCCPERRAEEVELPDLESIRVDQPPPLYQASSL